VFVLSPVLENLLSDFCWSGLELRKPPFDSALRKLFASSADETKEASRGLFVVLEH